MNWRSRGLTHIARDIFADKGKEWAVHCVDRVSPGVADEKTNGHVSLDKKLHPEVVTWLWAAREPTVKRVSSRMGCRCGKLCQGCGTTCELVEIAAGPRRERGCRVDDGFRTRMKRQAPTSRQERCERITTANCFHKASQADEQVNFYLFQPVLRV